MDSVTEPGAFSSSLAPYLLPGPAQEDFDDADGHPSGTSTASGTGRPSVFGFTVPPCPSPLTYPYYDEETCTTTVRTKLALNRTTDEQYPYPCGQKECWSCGVTAARRTVGAIFLAQPSHSFYLSDAPRDKAVIRDRMKRFSEKARSLDSSVRIAWAAEVYPNSPGAHVHGFLHADNAFKGEMHEVIVTARDRAGFGWMHGFHPVPRGASPKYFDYPLKSMGAEDTVLPFLELNGNPGYRMMIHGSRGSQGRGGFWRDGRGGPALTKRNAEDLAYQRHLEWKSNANPRLALAS